jgi:hypothetical protein
MRVGFEGAFYHVMRRGDHREAIVRDDANREIFLHGWAQASRHLPPCRPISKKRLAADRALRKYQY